MSVLDWHCAGRPHPDETESGDAARVVVDGHRALVAAVDGLGHGPAAALAAARALEAAAATPEAPPERLIERCHEALRGTRGAAVSVAAVDADSGTLTWLGVGNVGGHVVRAMRTSGRPRAESLLQLAGLVGERLPRLRASVLRVERGDLLVLATDGVDASLAEALEPSGSCRTIAERLLERFARPADDALVVVVRYLGPEP